MTHAPIPDAVLWELAPGGKLRLAANLANASVIEQTAPGRFTGPVAKLAQRLRALLGIAVEIRPFASGGEILARPQNWDAAVLAVDPGRTQLRFVYEVARVQATLAGRSDDPAMTCADADRDDCRIATTRGAAYEAHLLRTLTRAQVVPFDTPCASRNALISGICDFVAGIRPTLAQHLAGTPGIRLMNDDFLSLAQGLALPVQKSEAIAHLHGILADNFEQPPR